MEQTILTTKGNKFCLHHLQDGKFNDEAVRLIQVKNTGVLMDSEG